MSNTAIDNIDAMRADRDAVFCQARRARARGDYKAAGEHFNYANRLTDRILHAEWQVEQREAIKHLTATERG